MPMIDVYAANDLFPSGTEHQLGEELTFALLRADCVRTVPKPSCPWGQRYTSASEADSPSE